MLHKTKGIVINYVKLKETSILVSIFTQQFGMRTYIENSARSAKAKNKMALFQPLTLLDLVVYEQANKNISRISEMRCSHAYFSIPYKIEKSTVSIFLTEILKKCLKDETENQGLFQFLEYSFLNLDMLEKVSSFHLVFLVHLASYLGFSFEDPEYIAAEFKEVGERLYEPQAYQTLALLLQDSTFKTLPSLSNALKNETLALILAFYKIHVSGFQDLKSLPILREVLH
jgi:DNA repair protein RecO (recombination protein O)